MKNKGILSSTFNMSLGFIPVIVSILLCEFIPQDAAIYIGTVIGILETYHSLHRRGTLVPNFILFISTGILSFVSLATLMSGHFIPDHALPITLEVSILIPLLALYMHKKKFINHYLLQIDSCRKRLFAQGAESAIVSARITLLLGALHFIVITICIAFLGFSTVADNGVLFSTLPTYLFIATIVFNSMAIYWFNHLMSHTEYVPIVNIKGDVIGKSLAVEALNHKSSHISPVIRIATVSHGRLFLCKRLPSTILDKGKMDFPLECYPRFGESLTEAVDRIVRHALPDAVDIQPEFNIMYHFENEVTNRLVYLFLIDVKDDAMLSTPHFKESKLWSFKQIEENLGKSYFSNCFEEEYEHLKGVICIREKYKVF